MSEAKTISNRLTKSDRRLLKAFFGYIETDELQSIENREPLKSKKDACRYIFEALWADVDYQGEGVAETGSSDSHAPLRTGKNYVAHDEAPFRLKEVITDIGNIPSIFFNPGQTSEEDILKELRELFLQGRTYTDEQQTGMVRSFVTFPRLWESIRRIVISSPTGPVRKGAP